MNKPSIPSVDDMPTMQWIIFRMFSEFYLLATSYYERKHLSLQELKKFVLIYYTPIAQERVSILSGLDPRLKDANNFISRMTNPTYTELMLCSLDEATFEIIIKNAIPEKHSFVSAGDE